MIKLDDIIEELEFMNDETEIDIYYNLDTKKIFCSNIGELEDITEDELDELFENSIMFPTKY